MRAFCLILALAVGSITASDVPRDYSKRILGCWLGPRKFDVYHADGTWGVKRNEDAPEDVRGRRWHIEGRKLTLIYPGDHGLETAVYTIISCTPHKLILEADGYRREFTRYSADCQRPNQATKTTRGN